MYFISEKQGWTVAEGKQGSELWRTPDGGATWKKSALPDLNVRAVGFADESVGWIVGKTGRREEQGQRLCSQLRIVRSDDGGAKWTAQWQTKVQNVNLYSEDRVFPVSSQKAFVIAGYQMLETSDGGKQWKAVNFHIGPFIPEQGAFDQDGKHAWVMGRAGKGCKPEEQQAGEQCAITIVNTTDGGAHWNLQWSPQDSSNMRNVGISFINPKQGWFMVLSLENLQSSLYATRDGGATWTKVSEMRGGRPYTRGLQFVSETTGFVPLSAGAGPIGGGLAVTHDGGKTFERKIQEGQEWSFEQLKFFTDKAGWVRVYDPTKGDYLMFTADGGNTWKPSTPHL
ncbi:hypothetical protein LJK87_24725 [Paenibacillus sp. P25]|nr:hypothetical protein LJK87_24725 [Paenibacillus sp. P25]